MKDQITNGRITKHCVNEFQMAPDRECIGGYFLNGVCVGHLVKFSNGQYYLGEDALEIPYKDTLYTANGHPFKTKKDAEKFMREHEYVF